MSVVGKMMDRRIRAVRIFDDITQAVLMRWTKRDFDKLRARIERESLDAVRMHNAHLPNAIYTQR